MLEVVAQETHRGGQIAIAQRRRAGARHRRPQGVLGLLDERRRLRPRRSGLCRIVTAAGARPRATGRRCHAVRRRAGRGCLPRPRPGRRAARTCRSRRCRRRGGIARRSRRRAGCAGAGPAMRRPAGAARRARAWRRRDGSAAALSAGSLRPSASCGERAHAQAARTARPSHASADGRCRAEQHDDGAAWRRGAAQQWQRAA